MSHRYHNRRYVSNPFGCLIFVLVAFLIFYFPEWNYSSWIPLLLFVLIFGSCIMTAVNRRRRVQTTSISTDLPSQSNPSFTPNTYNSSSSPTSFHRDIEYQRIQSTPSPPQKMIKLCPMCGGVLDDESLKQLIISNRVYCKFCGNQIQK